MYGPTTNRRESWEVTLPVADVLRATESCVAYHGDRHAFWVGEKDAAERDIREKGVEFRSRQHTGGAYLETIIDPELQRRMNLCAAKLKSHDDALERYACYRMALHTMLERDGDATVPLTYDDLRFFRYAEVFPPKDDDDDE